MARRVLILGSTGSIGTQALEIVERSPDVVVVGLSAERSWERLVEQARTHGVTRVALSDPEAAARAAQAWPDGEVLAGAEGLVRLVVESDAHLVLNEANKDDPARGAALGVTAPPVETVAARAKALLWPSVDTTRGADEAALPGISSPSGMSGAASFMVAVPLGCTCGEDQLSVQSSRSRTSISREVKSPSR